MTDKKFALFVMALLVAVAPARAAPAGSNPGDKQRYDNCLQLAGTNPAAALEVAGKWIQEHAGAPAVHCAAVSLVGLKRYAEAGAKLDALGRAPDVGALRASLLDQAGNAWLLAGDASRASASFQGALALSANDPDFYADLARAQAVQKDWRGAESELNAALAIAPMRTDLLVLRAGARHALGNLSAARADTLAALKLRPNDVEALAERAGIARDAGDLAGARADFESVVKLGGRDAADLARRNLAALDEAAKPKPVAKPAPKPKPPAIPPAH